jgi:hypothetical protein
MTGASTGLESAETTLTNPGLRGSGSVCGETADARDVEAGWRDASGVSRGKGIFGPEGLGMTESLGKGARGGSRHRKP